MPIALHPILAEGPLAKWLVSDHELLQYSCGRRSPLARFEKLNGKVVFFDASFRSLTFVHLVEDMYKDRLPVALYEAEPACISMRLANGETIESRQFLFSAQARKRRSFENIENALIVKDKLLRRKIGNTQLIFTTARDVVSAAGELVTNKIGFYA